MGLLEILSKDLVVDPCNGKEIIAQAKDIFTGYLDPCFENWDLDKPSEPTEETKVIVYELIKDATLKQMFSDPDKFCLIQGQIIGFVKKHSEHLRTEGWATFFLFKRKDKFFVASVHLYSGGFGVCLRQFENDCVWHAGGHPRLVAPQPLTP